MDERLSRILDELDEKETSVLLCSDIEFHMDEVTSRRISSSVKKRIRSGHSHGQTAGRIGAAAAVIVLMALFTFSLFREKDLSYAVRKVMEYIPGYGVAEPLETGNQMEVPKQVLDLVEGLRVGHSLTKEKYTIGEKGYRVNYIGEIDLEKKYASMKDLMEEKEEWLFIVEDQGESHYSILIGKDRGRYSVLMSGGGAEMFYPTLSLMDPKKTGGLELLSYGGDQYLISEDGLVYQIPMTRTDYERDPEMFDTPLPEDVCIELILENQEKSMNSAPPYQLGSMGLVEQYHEKNQ